MTWIRSLPIFARIMTGFAVVLLLMAVGTATSLIGLQRIHVVDRVRTLAALLGEVNEATREQAAGMGQVSQVVGQLDRHTQQNASLVEQAAAAAASLRAQASTLVTAVGQFSVQGA